MVVSDAGGLKEVVQHGVSGIVVSKNNVNEATKAMVSFFEDVEMSKELGKAGRLRVKSEYEWKDSVIRMEGHYGKLLDIR